MSYNTFLQDIEKSFKRERFSVGPITDGAGAKRVTIKLRSNDAVTYSREDAQELADLINAAADACEVDQRSTSGARDD